MDQVLLKKNGKTICWKRLGLDDVDELERLMIEYCRSEPLHAALSSPKLEETEVAKARVSRNLGTRRYFAVILLVVNNTIFTKY